MEYVDGPITQVYGAGKEFAWQLGYGHLGEDKGVPVGTTARAIADGVVIHAGWAADCPQHLKNQILVMGDAPGIFVWILHQDQNGPWESLTCHGSDTRLNAGDRVVRGQPIMLSGNTGLSTGPHTHFEVFTRPCSNVPPFSRYNPRLQIQNEDARFGGGAPAAPAAPKPSGPAPLRVGPDGAKQRKRPRLDAPVVRVAGAGSEEAFTGWTVGQTVNGNNIWFVDKDGYMHATAFVNATRDGLPQQQADWLAPDEREVAGKARQRSYPFTDARVVREIEPETIERFNKVTLGTKVDGIDLWYGDNDGWVWAGGFLGGVRAAGLPSVPTPQYPAAPAPAPVPPVLPTKPAPVDYTFPKAFDMVTEVRPAAPGNFEVGNFPDAKAVEAIFVHQFNADEVADNPTVNKVTVHLDSVINTFQGKGRVASADFGVEGTRCVQFIKVAATGGDRAYAQGPDWNGKAWSIETYGAQDPVTMATVAKLIVQLEKLGGPKVLKRHQEAMATKCGQGVDLVKYRSMVTALTTAPPPPPATPADTPAETRLRQIQQSITDYFKERK